MLGKIDRYILSRFVKYFFINLLIISGILWFTKIVKFLEFATVKNISFTDFILLSILILCNLISFIIPLVILIAVIFTLYNFYHSKELFIFKSVGLSRLQIIKPFAMAFAVIILFNYLLLFYLNPLAERKITALKTALANQFLISVIEEETFNHIDEKMTIFVDQKDSSGVFKNIIIYNKDQDNNDVIVKAKEAKLIKYKDKIILGLNDGSRYIIKNHDIIKDHLIFQRYLTDLDFFNEEKEIFTPKKKISEHDILELFKKETLKNYKINKVITERNHRIIWPWLGFILGLIAITILLGGEYNRKGNVKKNLSVIISSLIFVICYFLLKNLIFQRINLVFVSYVYIIFFLVFLLFCNYINRVNQTNVAKNLIS